MPRRHSVLDKKFRLNCPDCANTRVQRFINNKVGVVCACGNVLGTPRCNSCNAPSDHPHQLNSGRWACLACESTFTFPRGRKTTKRRAKFTSPKKSSKLATRRRQSQMSPANDSNFVETVLAEMLFRKKQQLRSVDGIAPATFVNSISNLLASPPVVREGTLTPATRDVLADKLEQMYIEEPEAAVNASVESACNGSAICDQDSYEEIRSSSCEEMISESFSNNLDDSDSESYLDGLDDTWDSDISPVALCQTSFDY